MPSYPKSHGLSYRPSRPRKRKPPTRPRSDPVGDSASARKLANKNSDVPWNPMHRYRIIEFFTVFRAISELMICRQCNQCVKFLESGSRGLGFKLVLSCHCGRREIDSGPRINTGYEINRRIVFVMRLMGISNAGLNLFCSLMDICNGLNEASYNLIVEHIHKSAKSVFEWCAKIAVEDEKKENEKLERPLLNLKVSGDGTWRKRGFKSLYGVTTLIGYYSGKIVDLLVKSSYCQACTSWKSKEGSQKYDEWAEEHEEECCQNHEGSAGKMEVDSVVEMFTNSYQKYGVRYGNYIGDGNSKTFKGILDIAPYGNDLPVVKSECISHVAKRMGTRLRKIRKDKNLGGTNKLTENLIKKLSLYYGLAIKRNLNSVDDMKKAIMATYYHVCSTKEHPNHEYCPDGADSWCKWKKAESLGENSDLLEYHKPLDTDVCTEILPIYQDLSETGLLTRCLGGHTQNANESYNSTIWRLAPKHLNSGLITLKIASYLSAIIFNEGYGAILRVMDELQIQIGVNAKNFADNIDKKRQERQARRSQLATKEARTVRRQALNDKNNMFERVEGVLYGPGIDC